MLTGTLHMGWCGDNAPCETVNSSRGGQKQDISSKFQIRRQSISVKLLEISHQMSGGLSKSSAN